MIEVMKQALEAIDLELSAPTSEELQLASEKLCDARESLRKAIAELESQEPVAWIDLQKEAQQIVESKILWKKFIVDTPLANDIACWMADFALQHAHPPQRSESSGKPSAWVGLTNEERMDILLNLHRDKILSHMDTALAIEAKLKQKNT